MAAQMEYAKTLADIESAQAGLAHEELKVAVDLIGIADPTPITDAVGAVLALADGEWLDAGMSVVSMVPYGGDVIGKSVKGTKATYKLTKAAEALHKLHVLLANWAAAIRQAKKQAKALKKRNAARPPGFPRPKNPGDGGFSPDLKAASAKKPKIELKSPNACRDALRKNLAPKPTNMVDPHAHHDLPVKFQKDFAKRGIDINAAEHGRWVSQKRHNGWSGKFNEEWKRFFKDKPKATYDEVIAFRNILRGRYQ